MNVCYVVPYDMFVVFMRWGFVTLCELLTY